jgi:hypothetical protein
MLAASDGMFLAGAAVCDGVDAVYFELATGSPSLEVTLLDTSGRGLVAAHLNGGDHFYFELPDLHAMAFSERPS